MRFIDSKGEVLYGATFTNEEIEHAMAVLGLDISKMYSALKQCEMTTGRKPRSLIVGGSGLTFCGVPVVFANIEGIGYEVDG